MIQIPHALTVLNQKRVRSLLISSGITYLLFYLIAVRDIRLTSAPTQIQVGQLAAAIETQGFLYFKPVAKIVIEPVLIFIAPMNIIIGLFIGLLFGINIGLVYVVHRQPESCGISKKSGVLGSLPALFAGTACCGPIIPILLGIQITSAFVTFSKIAIPLSVILLASTIYILTKHISVS